MMRQFQTILCGDGEIDPTEACDAGAANGTPASCCTTACTAVSDLTACTDGNACTTNDRCAAGVCGGTPVGPPPEATGLTFGANGTSIAWTPIPGVPPGTVYDVARGPAGPWAVGSGAGETCLGAVAAPPATDAALPPPGQAFWYLVRGRNACGTGTYGRAATNGVPGAERITSACP